ncbi:MAG TPA: tryptophan 2,3-dioxygenase family protein [Gemmatimonadaceae bacterium]|nr:tryptophan 2,3-dioxygenase family protein [Gemmatimonadaceae bacterium]
MADEQGPTYPSYLRLDELLALQTPITQPAHPDELLFIVVHQASELWFKVILHELDGLVAAMQRRDTGAALWRLGRVNALMRIVSGQLAALDTLPPQRFLQFRGYLGTSSGSQSNQFRAIEARSGLRDEHFMHVVSEHGEVPAPVRRALEGPTLQELFLALVESEGTTIEALYTGPGPSPLFFLAEALLEYEQQFGIWRFKHVQIVERIIGPGTHGTGGTLGAKYLQRTVNQRFFPALWEVRHRLYAGPESH